MNGWNKINGVSHMFAQHLKIQTRQYARSLFGGIVLSGLMLGNALANTVESVTGALQSGVEVVRIDLAEPLKALPTGFVVQTPARIALDMPGVTSSLGRSLVEVNQGNLRSVNVVQSGDRTRLVLNLKQATNYKASIQGKTLIVALDPVVRPAPAGETSTRFAEPLNTDKLPIKDIDFRRVAEGVGRISVDLVNNQVGVDIRQQGQSLVVEFLKSSLPEALRRKMDVVDFGTPVQHITTFEMGDRVRMIIEPKGHWDHSAYQSDNKFVLEVRAQKVDPNKISQGKTYAGEKISLNFQSIEVRALLQVIADFTNFNIVTSDTVAGSVTLRLKDVPWDQALDIILEAKNLGMRKNGNVIVIGPKAELAAKEKLELESKNAVDNLAPLRTHSFQLNYAKAAEVAAQITNRGTGATGGTGANAGGSRLLSPRGSAIAVTRTNMLFVTDIESKIEAVQQLIDKLDIPVRQVLIEARIVEADDKFGRSLGVKLGGGPATALSKNAAFSTNYANVLTLSTTTPSGTPNYGASSGTFVNMPATGQGGFPAASFALSLFNSSKTRFLDLEVSAAEAEGRGKIVSSPRVITADGVKALIEQGTELPYQAATSSGATAVSFRKANLKLEVTPQITPEGNIILEVDINKDSVGLATSSGYAIDTKHVQTQVLVDNGGTVVIGGIFELVDRDDVTKVPVLGDVPVLGTLFRNKVRVSNKTELLIFITPKMISDRTGTR
jgi:type IV pilus assembly protein PilQ